MINLQRVNQCNSIKNMRGRGMAAEAFREVFEL